MKIIVIISMAKKTSAIVYSIHFSTVLIFLNIISIENSFRTHNQNRYTGSGRHRVFNSMGKERVDVNSNVYLVHPALPGEQTQL